MYKELYLKYKWYLIIAVPMSIALGIASMSVIAIISDTVGGGLANLDVSVGVFFTAILVLFALGLINDFFLSKMAADVNYDMQINMIRRVIATPLPQLEHIGLAKVVASLTEDMDTAVRFFHVMPLMFINIALVLCGIAYMAYLSLQLLVIVLGFMLFTGATIAGLLWYSKKDRVVIREATDHMMQHYQDVVQGAKELTLNTSRRRVFTRKIIDTASNIRRYTRRILNVLALTEQWARLLVFALLGIIIFFAGGVIPLTNEIILGYLITLLFLLEPIEVIANSADELVDAKVAFDKIDGLKLAAAPDGLALARSAAMPAVSPTITLELKDIEYSYALSGEARAFHFGPFSARFPSGQVTLITGGNGGGKSTLLKILCGLYPPCKGHIYSNNKRVKACDVEQFRNHFSVITANFCLFDELLDRQGQACLDHVVFALMKKLNLPRANFKTAGRVSTRNLSQGQRKRLALLQAICENKPVLLLDEWAADQDPASKRLFYKEILPALKKQGKTVIIVSHDEQYFDCADNVLKIDEGMLVSSRTVD